MDIKKKKTSTRIVKHRETSNFQIIEPVPDGERFVVVH